MLYTTLSHNLMEGKNTHLIKSIFQRKYPPYLICNDRNALFIYVEGLVTHIYPTKMQLNKTNSNLTEAAFLDLR